MSACPAWASASSKEAAGTRPGTIPAVSSSIAAREAPAGSGQLDLHIDARGEIELHQCVDRLRGRLHDVEQPFVSPDLELLARLLVDVRRAVDGELLDARRQGNGPADESTRAARRVGDVARRLVQHSMIESLEANTDILRFHVPTDAKEPASRSMTPRLANKPNSKANRATLFRIARLAPYITS